jgi:acyl carrier protein
MTPIEFLVDYFESRGLSLGTVLEEKLAVDYLARGLIDSMGLVSLIMAIEEAFAIQLGAEHMQSDAYLTIGGLAGLIEGLRAVSAPPGG